MATGSTEPRCWQRYLHSEKKISTPLLGSKKKSKFHERSQQITAAQAPWSVCSIPAGVTCLDPSQQWAGIQDMCPPVLAHEAFCPWGCKGA